MAFKDVGSGPFLYFGKGRGGLLAGSYVPMPSCVKRDIYGHPCRSYRDYWFLLSLFSFLLVYFSTHFHLKPNSLFATQIRHSFLNGLRTGLRPKKNGGRPRPSTGSGNEVGSFALPAVIPTRENDFSTKPKGEKDENHRNQNPYP